MRDRIETIITALAGLGFCGLGVKIAWWLIAMILTGASEGNWVKVIATGIIGYLGGVAAVVICLGIGIGLLVVSLDN